MKLLTCPLKDVLKGDFYMIKITLKNGNICKWKKKEYTDYKYDGKCFIVIKDDQYVGLYNMDSIISVVVRS